MKVFISHSTEDRAFVERHIVQLLNENGIETWYARDSILGATRWEREIRNGLKSCEQFLVVMSGRSAKSPWVKREVDWAFANNRPIIPVVMESCDPDEFHFGMAGIQHLDFGADPERASQQLLAILGVKPRMPAAPNRNAPSPGGSTAVRRNSLGTTLLPVPAALRPKATEGLHVAATCVTNREYAEFVASGGAEPRPNPKNKDQQTWIGQHFPKEMAEHPVILVKQADALAFCAWLTKKEQAQGRIAAEEYVLPTRTQWQAIACNAPLPATAVIDRAWRPGHWQPTEPVTYGEPTPLGLFGLFGNVFEWCQDVETRKFRVTTAGKAEAKLLPCALAIGGGWASAAQWLQQEMQKQTYGSIWCPGGWAMQDGGFRVWLNCKAI